MITPDILRERSFQSLIKEYLVNKNGYIEGNNDDYDKAYALDLKNLFTFLEDTQERQLNKLKEIYGSSYKQKIVKRLDSELRRKGMIEVIRHGIKDYGVKLKLAYFKPPTSFNSDLVELYNKNRLSVTEELKYKEDGRIDLVIFLNGLPIIAIELKNAFTGQTYKKAIKQFKEDRSPKELLFKFKQRVIVSFAMDTDEVYMTTRLRDDRTYFLPFNRGNNNGSGNPLVEGKVRTYYMWEEILKKDGLMEILHKFVYVQVEEDKNEDGDITKKETLIFPRYHQLDVVRRILSDVEFNGAGHTYLVQHSAGSGKTNSISWLVHRLASIHNLANEAIFDGVIVVTDRRVLDQQLQDSIYQLEHKRGLVAKIEKDSSQLANELNKGTKIIISTIQKFPFILDKLEALKDRNYAIIIDEAHSSTSGKNMAALTQSLTLEEAQRLDEDAEANETDAEDKIIDEIRRHGVQKNTSFFAFTATPKGSTLKMFGRDDKPFHLYSMKQAIEEGFILDVLKNYVTYKTYFKIAKKIEEDPEFEKAKATRAVSRFVSLHPHNIQQKTEIMIEHFRNVTRRKIGGKAKAMVVTSSRLHAVRYKLAFDKYIKKKGYRDMKALVAFSGTVKDDGAEHTESNMNGFSDTNTSNKFDTDEYKVLLVANKYQTGFDQPKLHTMFVDKKLNRVKAVQTLSRLNRTYPGKEDTFVLDFVNEEEDIQKAFEPYYEVTSLSGDVDPNELYTLEDALYEYRVINKQDVENFVEIFYKESKARNDIQLFNHYIDNTAERVNNLEKEEKYDFRGKAKKFINLYTFILQITPFEDVSLHKLNIYLRYLIKKINIETTGSINLSDKLALEYYKIQKKSEGSIKLGEEQTQLTIDIGSGGGKKEEDKDTLSEIIKKLNDRFETDFSENERLAVEQIMDGLKSNEDLKIKAKNNTLDNFKLAYDSAFMNSVVDRYERNQSFYGKILEDEEFKSKLMELMVIQTYNELKGVNKSS